MPKPTKTAGTALEEKVLEAGYLTLHQAAERVGCHYMTLWRAVEDKALEAEYVSKVDRHFVHIDKLADWHNRLSDHSRKIIGWQHRA